MPNWCNNNLTVEGNAKDLEDFKKNVLIASEQIKDDVEFTMELLCPTPTELITRISPNMWRGDDNDVESKSEFEKHSNELKEKYGFADWYDWRISHWGTKWDVSDSYVSEVSDEVLAISYNTAWNPNDSFIRYASKKYPNLRFSLVYDETGCNFGGILECEGGEVITEACQPLRMVDGDGNEVDWNTELEKWFIVKTKEIIDDDDFQPDHINPFI